MAVIKDRLIKLIIEAKQIDRSQIDEVLLIHKREGKSFKKILIDKGIISEEDLLRIISKHLFIPTIHLDNYKIDPSVLKLVPERLVIQYTLIPIAKTENSITVAMSDPLNVLALDDLKALTGLLNIEVVIASEAEVLLAIESCYGQGVKDISKIFDEKSLQESTLDVVKDDDAAIQLGEMLEASGLPPIVKLVDSILTDALKKRASDIHFEPEENILRVRYRIDGLLHEVFNLPKKNQNAVLARIKIISRLDITESRVPQDGRFKVKLGTREVDFRVSALPTIFGQKFVLRTLDKANLAIGLDKLGFSPEPHRLFQEAISRPHGMILVTGPTGSGKSTTLYSILNQLNTIERHLITVEDPVEYQVEGIGQIQVNSEIGLTFAAGLRSILRQSPDIIMIGEIRDSETADIAVKAALTGQMVFSTLHTNDSVSSVTRMIDMGVEPFLVASSFIMVCAQRLCRKICSYCKEKEDVPEELVKQLEIKEKITYYTAKGCSRCNNTGFHGRMAVLESFMLDETSREMIIEGRSSDEIKAHAVKNLGMKTLRDDAVLKLKEGLTNLAEVLRVTTEE